MYICHFIRPLEEEFIQKFFGQVGKIKEIQIGEYKNKACNKRKRRTIYFAIVIFKKASDAAKILVDVEGQKKMQQVVNKTVKKNVKYVEFGDESEDDQNDEDRPLTQEEQHNLEMEEGGFTIVKAGADTMKSVKAKVSDGKETVMLGISQEEA